MANENVIESVEVHANGREKERDGYSTMKKANLCESVFDVQWAPITNSKSMPMTHTS